MEQTAFAWSDDEPKEKTCSNCKVVWPLAIYHNKRTAKDGKQDKCPSCRAVANIKSHRTAAKKAKRRKKEVVYFIHQVGTDWWKVGKTDNKEGRVSSLQTGNPRELVIIDHDEGYTNVEWEWHQIFARRRGRGEWFYMGPEEYIIREATPTDPIVVWEPELT